jgi:multimeric flavodoxin WrbA
MWVAAHRIMIVTPVHWYQTSSPLKLMIDRLVCADGGNPDPTRTHGKDAKRAKEIEMAGWDYPRHLENRLFAVVIHGDVEGVENVRRAISDWLCFMHLRSAGTKAELDPLHRLLETLRDEPCRARPGPRDPAGGGQCGADAARGGARRPRRHPCRARRRVARSPAEVGDILSRFAVRLDPCH